MTPPTPFSLASFLLASLIFYGSISQLDLPGNAPPPPPCLDFVYCNPSIIPVGIKIAKQKHEWEILLAFFGAFKLLFWSLSLLTSPFIL